MEIKCNRKYRNVRNGTRVYCVDKIYADGAYVCDAMEDKDWGWNKDTPESEITAVKARNKGKTAIPAGRYAVTTDIVSPKFSASKYYRTLCGGRLPRLVSVPCFQGILIHCGSSELNSSGCIIVGYNTYKGGLTDTRGAFEKLYKRMLEAKARKEEIWITVE